jgi:hypothetical protein
MIEWISNNMQWLFSGIGVVAAIFLIGVFRKLFKPGNPTSPSNLAAQSAVQPVSSTAPSPEHVTTLSPGDILNEVKGRPPYQQVDAARAYVGLKARWQVALWSVKPNKDSVRLSLDSGKDGPLVFCTMPVHTYPAIKTDKKGKELWVTGTIAEVETHGIELTNASVTPA